MKYGPQSQERRIVVHEIELVNVRGILLFNKILVSLFENILLSFQKREIIRR